MAPPGRVAPPAPAFQLGERFGHNAPMWIDRARIIIIRLFVGGRPAIGVGCEQRRRDAAMDGVLGHAGGSHDRRGTPLAIHCGLLSRNGATSAPMRWASLRNMSWP